VRDRRNRENGQIFRAPPAARTEWMKPARSSGIRLQNLALFVEAARDQMASHDQLFIPSDHVSLKRNVLADISVYAAVMPAKIHFRGISSCGK
jgi:hypothetical protein